MTTPRETATTYFDSWKRNVLTWFDLYLDDAPAAATVNWQHVEDGNVARIRVTVDPRAILERQQAA